MRTLVTKATLERGFALARTLGITGVIALAASAIVTTIGTSMLFDVEAIRSVPQAADDKPRSKPGSGKTAAAYAAKVKAKREAVETILGRNAFCPTCVPVGEQRPPDPLPLPSRPGVAPGEPASELQLRLVATLLPVDEGIPFATIYDRELGISGLFSPGEEVRAGVVVERIDHAMVHLRNSGRLEYVELGAQEDPKKSAKKSAPKDDKSKKKKVNKRAIPGADEAIECKTSDVCVVQRAFVDKVVANPALLAKQARVVPSRKNGETLGYKLYGIRRGTLPKLLGFRNGDMITEINGKALTSIDAAMGLYTKLRRASNLEVAFVRKGKHTTKEIQII